MLNKNFLLVHFINLFIKPFFLHLNIILLHQNLFLLFLYFFHLFLEKIWLLLIIFNLINILLLLESYLVISDIQFLFLTQWISLIGLFIQYFDLIFFQILFNLYLRTVLIFQFNYLIIIIVFFYKQDVFIEGLLFLYLNMLFILYYIEFYILFLLWYIKTANI